jgi:hypothetical protein
MVCLLVVAAANGQVRFQMKPITVGAIKKADSLKLELKTIQRRQHNNDSALAVAMTELKILSKLGKI